MRRFLSLLGVLVLLAACQKDSELVNPVQIQEGTLEFVEIPATDPLINLGGYDSAAIYLPPNYDPNQTYPLLVILHGFGGNYLSWSVFPGIKGILDYLISTDSLSPVIAVMPSGENPFGGSFYTDSRYMGQPVFGQYETYITQDVLSYMVENYPVDTAKVALMGISMGGYGTAKLGFKHPDLFKAIAAHSAPLAFDLFLVQDTATGLSMLDYVRMENMHLDTIAPDSVDTLYYIPTDPAVLMGGYLGPQRPLTTFLFAMSAAFTPKVGAYTDFDLSRYEIPLQEVAPGTYAGVRLPFDTSWTILSDVFSEWREHDPWQLAFTNEAAIKAAGLKIFLDCGAMDELSLAPHTEYLGQSLEQSGFDVTYEVYPGYDPYPPDVYQPTHVGMLYLRTKVSLRFFETRLFNPPQ